MEKETFRKEERLCSKRSIDDLFRKGSSFVLYPFRIVFHRPSLELFGNGDTSDQAWVKVLISVPKRKIKHAADRNLMKRRMREAYRKLKHERFAQFREQQQPVYLALQYLSSKPRDYGEIYTLLEEALQKLRTEYAQVYLGEDH